MAVLGMKVGRIKRAQPYPRPIGGINQFYGKCIDFFAELDVLL